MTPSVRLDPFGPASAYHTPHPSARDVTLLEHRGVSVGTTWLLI